MTEGTTVAQVSALSTLRRALDRVAGRGDGGDLWRAVRDPRTIQRVGSRPDYRFSLANERTFLAWVRTALGYEGKPFQSVTQGAAALDTIPVTEGSETAEAAPESAVRSDGQLVRRYERRAGCLAFRPALSEAHPESAERVRHGDEVHEGGEDL